MLTNIQLPVGVFRTDLVLFTHGHIVHGEAQASDALRVKLRDQLGWKAEIPNLYDIKEIMF